MTGKQANAQQAREGGGADWRGYVRALGVVALTTGAGWPLYHRLHIDNANILMLYLVGVLWIATYQSRSAAVLTCVLSVAAFDFVFVPPYYRFAVAEDRYVVIFAVMLLTALVLSAMAQRVRRQAAEARRAWQRAEAEAVRNTLLSGVSHELRTPLAAITGAVTALTEAGRPLSAGEQREMLETILSEAQRMERLIGNLLDMTRMEAGGLTLKKEWLSVQEVVGSALYSLRGRLGDRQVRTAIGSDLPLVHADPVSLEQVLVNLLDNAIAYAPGPAPIEISARRGEHEMVIEVADRGPGLPAGAEERVFEKFFRVSPPGAAAHHGLGLGLTICRCIVTAHGGWIKAANRGGGGAVFQVALPLSEAPPPMDANA